MQFLFQMTKGDPPDARAWEKVWSIQCPDNGKPGMAYMWQLAIHPMWMWE